MIELDATNLPQFRRSAGRWTQTDLALSLPGQSFYFIHPLVFQPGEAQVPLPSP